METVAEKDFSGAPSPRGSNKRLRGFLWIGFIITAVGLVLSIVQFSPRSAGRSDTVISLISGGEVPISIGGTTVKATDALFAENTSLATASDKCKTQDQQYVPHAGNRLTQSILVLQVTGFGTACVPDGQSRHFGSVNIEARNLATKAIDGSSKPLQHSDGEDVNFKEIGLWVEPSLSGKIQSFMPSALLSLGLGIVATCLFELVRLKGLRDNPNAQLR